MGKLIRYDAMRLWRFGRIFMIILAVSALLSALLIGWALNMLYASADFNMSYSILPSMMMIAGAFLLFGGILVLAAFPFLVYAHYYKGMFSDEGYLTNVLPYKTETLFYSKFLTGTIGTALFYVYGAICGIVALILCMLVTGAFGTDTPTVDTTYPVYVPSVLGNLAVLTAILDAIVYFFASFALVYCIITVVSLFVKKARLIAGIGICYAVSLVGSLIFDLMIPSIVTNAFLDRTMNYEFYSDLSSFLSIVIRLLYHIALFLVSFMLNRHLLQKKLNLE